MINKKCSAKDCQCIRPKFGKHKSNNDGLQKFCKHCRSRKRKATYKTVVVEDIGTRICKNDKCKKKFKYSTKTKETKLFCKTSCKNKYYNSKRVFDSGGQFATTSRNRAISRIESRKATKRYKHYTDKEILLIDSNIDIKILAKKLNRSCGAIRKKRKKLNEAKKISISTNRKIDNSYGGANYDNF